MKSILNTLSSFNNYDLSKVFIAKFLLISSFFAIYTLEVEPLPINLTIL